MRGFNSNRRKPIDFGVAILFQPICRRLMPSLRQAVIYNTFRRQVGNVNDL